MIFKFLLLFLYLTESTSQVKEHGFEGLDFNE